MDEEDLPIAPAAYTKPPTDYHFVTLQPGTRYFADAVQLYVETWPDEPVNITDFFLRYARLPYYHGLAALHDGALVGFGFGTRSLPGNWWHDRVAAHVGIDHPALQEAWGLVDLAVAAAHRGRGIGTALMETLLSAQPCPRALLSTEIENTGAQRLYIRHGWRVLHPGFAFNPGDKVYVVMRRELRAEG